MPIRDEILPDAKWAKYSSQGNIDHINLAPKGRDIAQHKEKGKIFFSRGQIWSVMLENTVNICFVIWKPNLKWIETHHNIFNIEIRSSVLC